MKNVFIILFFALCNIFNCLKAEIKFSKEYNRWDLITNNSLYRLKLSDNGDIYPVYWGHKSQINNDNDQDRIRHNGPYQLNEVPVRGRYADKMPILEVVYKDNTRDIELSFIKAEKIEIDGRETLKITQKDKYYPLIVISYLRVLPEYDIIEKWIEIENTGDKKNKILVENALSGSVYLPSDRYFLNYHSGEWLKEFQHRKVELTSGIKTIQARDFYSFLSNPWFAITNNSENNNGEIWFGQIHYSGNWKIDFEVTHSNHLQIVGGINFWDTSLTLDSKETFVTPKFSIGYSPNGINLASQLTHSYIRNEILPEKTSKTIRPIIYNSWYATAFDVNEEHQYELAKKAKDLGVELFVIDDGWFKGRKSDNAGLGDWVVDTEKFPNGLNPLIKKINDLGMDFGIWIEPEMVNKNSDLYRKHPEWVLYFDNREKTEWRNQLTLNLAREDVYEYLLESITNLLSQHNIKFIKWDRNRGLTQPGWPSANSDVQREVRLRYIDNLYRLIDELKSRFPDVMFETCSSGAGRPDLGMLSRMDQTWASDNTDPIDRLFIQYGFLDSYPANTMVCWTNNSNAHSANFGLDFVFDVAMQGVLGIGQDITKWNSSQVDVAKSKISEYKSIREIIQYGDVTKLYNPYEDNKVALQYKKANDVVVLCYNLSEETKGINTLSFSKAKLKLQNLDYTSMYRIDGLQGEFTGEYLCNVGIDWPVVGVYKSKILKIKKLTNL